MRIRTAAGAALAAAALAVAAGCDSGPATGDVSGTVTFDGKPLEAGAISFVPADGKSPTAGAVVKDGKYSAAKVPVGAAKVVINGTKVVGQKKVYNTPDSPTMPLTAELLPVRYHEKTELTYEVKSGSQTKDFDLTK